MANGLLQQGIGLVEIGQKAEGARVLRHYLESQPNDLTGLLWLAQASADTNEQIAVAGRILAIQPENVLARQIMLSAVQSQYANHTTPPNVNLANGTPVVTAGVSVAQPVATSRPFSLQSWLQSGLVFGLVATLMVGLALILAVILWFSPSSASTSYVGSGGGFTPGGVADTISSEPSLRANPSGPAPTLEPVGLIQPAATLPPYQPVVLRIGDKPFGVILEDETNVFSSYDRASPFMGTLSQGKIVTLDAQTDLLIDGVGQWLRLSKSDGGGWIESEGVHLCSSYREANLYARGLLGLNTATPSPLSKPAPTPTPLKKLFPVSPVASPEPDAPQDPTAAPAKNPAATTVAAGPTKAAPTPPVRTTTGPSATNTNAPAVTTPLPPPPAATPTVAPAVPTNLPTSGGGQPPHLPATQVPIPVPTPTPHNTPYG